MMMHKESDGNVVTSAKMILSSILCCVVLMYVLQIRSILAFLRRRLTGKRLPPGPPAWPIVGNLLSIRSNPEESLANLSKIYGPIMTMRFGLHTAVVFSSSEMARAVLKTHDRIFGHRPPSCAMDAWGSNIKLASTYSSGHGDEWTDVKKIWQSELLSSKKLDGNTAGRTEEVLFALRGLVESAERSKQAGDAVSEKLSDYLFHLWVNMSTRAAFSKRLLPSYADFKSNEFSQTISTMVNTLNEYDVREAFPFLKMLDLQGKSETLRTYKEKFRSMLSVHVDARLEEYRFGSKQKEHSEQDFLDALYFSEAGRKIPEHLKMELLMIMFTGTPSSGTTIDWVMAELFQNPACLEKCRKQLDAVVGRERLVSEADLPRLPYVRAILLETIRLHPLAAYLLPRQSVEDCEVGGYFIPAYTTVLVNLRAIHRDPKSWSNPLDFNPDRHFKSPDGSVDMNIDDFTLIAFGAGRRACPGRRSSWHQLQFALATLLHALDFELADDVQPKDLNMSWVSRIDCRRVEPLKVIPKLRIPRSVIFT